jgi:UDP:flavonoid glycosyltransferase YjiC (YdhE family)
MARILLTWELGGGSGHLASLSALADALRARGHEVTLALKDLSRAERFLPGATYTVLQAPVWTPQIQGLNTPLNYSEILGFHGYLDRDGLSALLRAWRHLFAFTQPDLIVCDHSPTALLAARGLSIARAAIGSGFMCPPRATPMPFMQWWQSSVPARLAQSETVLLTNINAALGALREAPLETIADIFDIDETFITGWPELDHYPSRAGTAKYWGTIDENDHGAEPIWPNQGREKIFAYFAYMNEAVAKQALPLLRDSPYSVLLHAGGLAPATVATLASPRLTFSPAMLRMSSVLKDAVAVVSHTGYGTVAAALLAGKPVLLMPVQFEQYMFSKRIERLGAGLILEPSQKDAAAMLRKLVEEPHYTQAAQTFAQRYANETTALRVDAIVNRCEELLTTR